MSMTDTTTTRPLQPPACALWCEHHEDHGLLDEECTSASALILPESEHRTRSYVHAQLVEHRERHAEKWVTDQPKVLLRVDNPVGTDLSLAEAKQLSQTLNDLITVAELGRLA